MTPDQKIDTLIATLNDSSPNRAIYSSYIASVEFNILMGKALELQNNSQIYKPAAVFASWAKRELQKAPQPQPNVTVRAFNEADPLQGFEEAVAAL